MLRLSTACCIAMLTLSPAVLAQDQSPQDAFADEKIERAAIERIYGSDAPTATAENGAAARIHVNVTSFNHHLLLTGEAPSAAVRDQIGRLAAEVPGVRVISNEIVVGEVTGIASRTTDSLITSDVRSRLRNSPDIISSRYKVVTEAGTVFLMGMVRRQNGRAAAEVASTTQRVERVVLVYDYRD